MLRATCLPFAFKNQRMLLTEHNLFYYLLDKGMVDKDKVIDGEFTVRRSDSRNNNFLVNREYDHHAYFIKQVKAFEAEKTETLRTEAHCYQLANTDPGYKALKQFLPAFFHYDPLSHVLVTGQVKNAVSVFDFYYRSVNSKIPEIIADILASYHGTISSALLLQPAFAHFRKQKPWVFSVATTPPGFWSQEGQAAEQQMMQLIHKNRDYVQLLSQLEHEWQPQTLVHNDAKFNNFLISYDSETNDIQFIQLIDWELADIGDPLWDVATIFQNYLSLWVTTDVPEQTGPKGFKITLPQVQPAMQQFWRRYTAQMKWTPEQAAGLLVKATRFCALKLIHACFETTPYSPTLQPLSVKLLQLSFNILRSPQEAAVKLLGITNTFQNESHFQYA